MRALLLVASLMVVCGGFANAEDTESVLKKKWSEYEGGPGYNVKQDGDP
jgi:hypothetical protein